MMQQLSDFAYYMAPVLCGLATVAGVGFFLWLTGYPHSGDEYDRDR